MRSILFFILLVPFAFVGALKAVPGIKHTSHTAMSLKSKPAGIDTNIVVWFEGKPLRYYQYIKYLKTGVYAISSRFNFNEGRVEEGNKELRKLDDKWLKNASMDAASIDKRIEQMLYKPAMKSLSQLDTNIIVYQNKRPLRYYQYMPILLTGKYVVRMDSGKRWIGGLEGQGLAYFTRDSITTNNAIVNWMNRADRIIVEKAKRRLYIERNGKRLFDFPINLGKSPVGHKLKEGDGRTPEGLYYLDYNINVEASYHLGFHISYPNADDIARAKKQGVKPGGDIMIHGTSPARSKLKDWTNGCIAIANNHLDTIMKYQYRTIPIEIRK
nr:L,D-transpeptidase family protein [uncultured Mucilaginibacter sp.]